MRTLLSKSFLYSSLILGAIIFANPHSATAMDDIRPGRCTINVCVVRTDLGDDILTTTQYYVWTPSGWELQQSIDKITPKSQKVK